MTTINIAVEMDGSAAALTVDFVAFDDAPVSTIGTPVGLLLIWTYAS